MIQRSLWTLFSCSAAGCSTAGYRDRQSHEIDSEEENLEKKTNHVFQNTVGESIDQDHFDHLRNGDDR